MRPLQTAVLFLLLFGLVVSGLPQSYAASSTGYSTKTARTVWVTPYYTRIQDVVLINNTGNTAVSSIDFKIPAAEYAHMYSMNARDGAGNNLQIALLGVPLANFTFYRVSLDSPIVAGHTGSATIDRYLMFFGSASSLDSSNATVSVVVNPTILLLGPITKANFTAFVPSTKSSFDFTPATYVLGNVTYTFTRNFSASSITGNLTAIPEADSLQPMTITFSGDPGTAKATNEVYITAANTTINLGDTITAESTFEIYNARGGSDVGKTTSLLLTLPAAVQSTVTASDFTGDLGTLATTPSPSGSYLNVTLPLRYDMRPNETYTLTMDYQLNPSSVLTKVGDRYTFNLQSVSLFMPFIIHLNVLLTGPYGSDALKALPTFITPSAQGSSGGSEYVRYDFVNSSSFVSQNLNLSFNYAWYWGLIKPWFYVSFLYLIGLLGAAVYLREKPVSVAEAPAIMGDLRKFCDLYDEKIAHNVELQKLEDSLKKGKIAKPIYDRRVQEIDATTENLDRQLGDLRRSIRESAPRYSRNLDQIELLEAELRTVTATVKDLQRQVAARKVSRRVYDDLMYTYEGRMRKIQGRIDSILIGLREAR